MAFDIEDLTVVLRRVTDQEAQRLTALRQSLAPQTPAAHDDVLPLAPGAAMVDSLTGEIVEVVSGQRTNSLV